MKKIIITVIIFIPFPLIVLHPIKCVSSNSFEITAVLEAAPPLTTDEVSSIPNLFENFVNSNNNMSHEVHKQLKRNTTLIHSAHIFGPVLENEEKKYRRKHFPMIVGWLSMTVILLLFQSLTFSLPSIFSVAFVCVCVWHTVCCYVCTLHI